eukprot:1065938-Prymnesium_polylepis.1
MAGASVSAGVRWAKGEGGRACERKLPRPHTGPYTRPHTGPYTRLGLAHPHKVVGIAGTPGAALPRPRAHLLDDKV